MDVGCYNVYSSLYEIENGNMLSGFSFPVKQIKPLDRLGMNLKKLTINFKFKLI